MQGVFTKFLQLWIPNKTDKGSVVTDVFEPNFTKLDQNAESVNKTLDNLSNNKLDKGTYTGDASNLKSEIDGKVSKSGGTITGTLNINMEGKDKVVLKSQGTTDGVVGSDTDGVIVGNSKSGKSIRLNNDGVGIYPSTSLKTEAKDLSGAVNELLDNKYKIEYKTIGSPTEELDILEFALTAVDGHYRSQAGNNMITSLPEGIPTPAFECRISSINTNGGYRTIELKSFNSNDIYINTQINFTAGGVHPTWLGWNKLLNDRDGSDFVKKAGDTMTGTLTISGSDFPEVVFNNDGLAAVGYDVDGESAYLRAAKGTGLIIYADNTATLKANNLNTKNKEVVAAINELNSRGFVKIGECSIVNQSVSIYGYNEFVVCEQYAQNTILDIKYFTKDIVNSLKSFKFVSYSRELECEWVFSADGNTITLTNLGAASDGGIYVYGR